MTPENFASEYPKKDDGEPVAYDNHKGFNVGEATTQYGIDMEASYDQPTEKVAFSAEKEMELAGLNIKGEYDATYKKDQAIEHQIAVKHTDDLGASAAGSGTPALALPSTRITSMATTAGTLAQSTRLLTVSISVPSTTPLMAPPLTPA